MAQDRTGLRKPAAVERRPVAATTVQRSAAAAVSPVQALQRRLGNQGTHALISRSIAAPAQVSVAAPASVQFARVSQPNDPAELEAREVARKVANMTEPAKPAAAKTDEKEKKKTVQRDAIPAAAPAPAAASVSAVGGSPLPSGVRSFMEPRFGADFGNVRIHTGEAAAQQSSALSAHAFTVGEHVFFGRDQFKPESASGRELIAHELTHTVQQGVAVQRSEDTTVSQHAPVGVQRLGISDALDWIADKANYIPGFRLLTIVVGINPINMAPVERSAANILRALLELIPVTGALVAQALDSYGIFAKVGAWMETRIRGLGLVGSALKGALSKFLDSLSWRDIFDLGGVWDRAKAIFLGPIDSLINLGKAVVGDIIAFVREAILLPLAKLAEGTRGYDLLKAVLGQDPVTGEVVPRTPEILIGGFMKFIGQEDVWENIKKSNAIPRAWAWFQAALAGLLGFLRQIPALFMAALKSLEIIDLILPPKAFIKIAGVFAGFAVQFVTWAGNAVWNLLEIVFDVVSPGAFLYIKKTGAALKSILKNPLPFVGNLVKAAKLGFLNFADNFFTHLKAGLIDWLTGSLPGIYIPKAFSLPEIGKFVFSVLGLSWANIRLKLVKAVGETAVKAMETGFDIVVTLVRDGPAAAWDKIKEQLSNLKDMVIGGITDFVIDMVVKKAIPKLIAMFIPGAGFISAILSIYDTIMVFVNKIAKIIQVVTGFIDSLVAIAGGAIGAAATRVENALANVLSLAINFLAGFAGLGKVADKVMAVIEKVRAPIDKALDWLVNWIVTLAKKIGKFAVDKASAVLDWWKEKLGFTNEDGETHTLQFIGTGDSATMGIATNLMSVRQYLDSHPKIGTPVWNTANSVFNDEMKVIYSPARKTEDEKKRRAEIKKSLAKVSAAFAKLGGGPPGPGDYEQTTAPTYGDPTSSVKMIVDKPMEGSKTGPWPSDRDGFKEVSHLTTATDKWVQMHIISEKLGGSGTDFGNLVPAPNSVNTGPFRTFEHATASLVKAKSGGVKNAVWVEVTIAGTKKAPTGITGRAGLHFWKGKNATPKWLKNDAPSFTVSAGIPVPQKAGPRKLVLNFTSGTEMTRDFGIDPEIARLVKEGRRYDSEQAFVESMQKRNAKPGPLKALFKHAPVLDGP